MGITVIAFSSFMIAFSGALVPGPLFTITVAETAKRGFLAGPLVIVGHGILELFMISLLLLGIKPFLTSPSTLLFISIGGGLMLVYMGYRMIRDARTAKLVVSANESRKGPHPILSGILGSISNPYWTIWWITIGLGYLVSSLKFGVIGVLAFFVGHIMADLGWYAFISFAIAKGKRIIGDRGYRYLLYACGTFLLVFGVWFVKGVDLISQ